MKRCTKEVDRAISLPRFEVLKGLMDGLNITEISKKRKVYRSATYKVIHALEEGNYIENVGGENPKTYQITNKGIKGVHSFVALKHNLRPHNIHYKIEILEKPRNWDKARQKLMRLPYFNKRIDLKNNEQYLFDFQKMQIKATTRSVIIKLPTLYSKNLNDAIIQSMDMLYDAIPKVERLFKIKLLKDYKANITIISQEWARLQDALAKVYRIEKKKLYVRDEDGNIWLIADYSFSTDETETVSPISADDDMEGISPLLNDFRDNRPRVNSQIDQDLLGVKKVLVDTAKNINTLAKENKKVVDMRNKDFENISKFQEQIAVHIPAYEGMKDEVSKLNGAIGLLITEIKKINKK